MILLVIVFVLLLVVGARLLRGFLYGGMGGWFGGWGRPFWSGWFGGPTRWDRGPGPRGDAGWNDPMMHEAGGAQRGPGGPGMDGGRRGGPEGPGGPGGRGRV